MLVLITSCASVTTLGALTQAGLEITKQRRLKKEAACDLSCVNTYENIEQREICLQVECVFWYDRDDHDAWVW